jgi:hypothetical protein
MVGSTRMVVRKICCKRGLDVSGFGTGTKCGLL